MKSYKKNKKKVDKKELLVVIKERKEAEAEVKEERRATEEIQAKTEVHKSLLLRLKNGDLPLSELQNMDIESLVAGPFWRK